jgi:glycosyltransferase involved in cell wall biosynthesis
MKHLDPGLWTIAQEQDKSLEFILSPANYIHDRSRRQSSIKDWKDYWQHASDAWFKAQENEAGLITAFPQLPVCAGIRKRLSRKSTPLVAWTFNLGALHGKHKQLLARSSLKSVNKFIVHSSAEIANYSKYLDLPENRFEFVPLHKPIMVQTDFENTEAPFILAMGSANRDYETLLRAIKKLKYPLTIVAPHHALSGLEIPPNVTIKSNLSLQECRTLVQQARINVIPINNEFTASGQVTVIEAMMYKKAVIATDTIGTRDYIKNETTGLLVPPKSEKELADSINLLWENEGIRESFATQAQDYVRDELSQTRTASRLINILNTFT